LITKQWKDEQNKKKYYHTNYTRWIGKDKTEIPSKIAVTDYAQAQFRMLRHLLDTIQIEENCNHLRKTYSTHGNAVARRSP
jgi:hypothetical protein